MPYARCCVPSVQSANSGTCPRPTAHRLRRLAVVADVHGHLAKEDLEAHGDVRRRLRDAHLEELEVVGDDNVLQRHAALELRVGLDDRRVDGVVVDLDVDGVQVFRREQARSVHLGVRALHADVERARHARLDVEDRADDGRALEDVAAELSQST